MSIGIWDSQHFSSLKKQKQKQSSSVDGAVGRRFSSTIIRHRRQRSAVGRKSKSFHDSVDKAWPVDYWLRIKYDVRSCSPSQRSREPGIKDRRRRQQRQCKAVKTTATSSLRLESIESRHRDEPRIIIGSPRSLELMVDLLLPPRSRMRAPAITVSFSSAELASARTL